MVLTFYNNKFTLLANVTMIQWGQCKGTTVFGISINHGSVQIKCSVKMQNDDQQRMKKTYMSEKTTISYPLALFPPEYI